MKAWVYATIAALFAALTGFSVLGVAVEAANPARSATAAFGVVVFGACSVIFAVPTIVFLGLHAMKKKQEQELEDFAKVLRAYPEVAVADLARQFGKGGAQIEELIGKAIAAKMVRGWLNPQMRSFQNFMFPPKALQVVASVPPSTLESGAGARFCARCGDPLQGAPSSNAWQCARCGHVQSADA